MNRLTQILSNGEAGVAGCGRNCKHGFRYCGHMEECPTIDEIINRLAQYENIGLTPEQLLQVDKMYTDRCEEIAELEGRVSKRTVRGFGSL